MGMFGQEMPCVACVEQGLPAGHPMALLRTSLRLGVPGEGSSSPATGTPRRPEQCVGLECERSREAVWEW